MVILVNFSNNPFKIQYRDGSKAFVKAIPSYKIVAMKGLRVSEQITNRAELARQGVTIYDYEKGTYYKNNGASYANFPYIFIGNDVKQSTVSTINLGSTGTTTVSAATFTQTNASTPTVYGFTLTADTNGTSGIITATTVGSNTYIAFKAPTTSAQLVTGLTASVGYTNLGITTSGGNTTALSASTFYLSATTAQSAAVYYNFLKGLI